MVDAKSLADECIWCGEHVSGMLRSILRHTGMHKSLYMLSEKIWRPYKIISDSEYRNVYFYNYLFYVTQYASVFSSINPSKVLITSLQKIE